MILKSICVRFILNWGKKKCGIKNKDRCIFQSQVGVWSNTPFIKPQWTWMLTCVSVVQKRYKWFLFYRKDNSKIIVLFNSKIIVLLPCSTFTTFVFNLTKLFQHFFVKSYKFLLLKWTLKYIYHFSDKSFLYIHFIFVWKLHFNSFKITLWQCFKLHTSVVLTLTCMIF